MQKLEAFATLLKNRVNLFYILAFIPLLIVSYFNIFGVIIPTFGFLLLFLKKQDLPLSFEANLVERALGFSIIFSSFFLYFALVPFVFSSMFYYSVANYILYIFGLYILMFGLPSLKNAFIPLFVMAVASSNPFVSKWLEPYLSPYVVPFFTNLILNILRVLGIPTCVPLSGVIVLQTWNGPLPLRIIWNCVGVDSMTVFSVILVVMLFEEVGGIKTKLLWSFIGVLGTFLINVARVTLIFVTDYFYGSEAGGRLHFSVGYILFIAWLGFFLFVFSKRQAILKRTQQIWHIREHSL